MRVDVSSASTLSRLAEAGHIPEDCAYRNGALTDSVMHVSDRPTADVRAAIECRVRDIASRLFSGESEGLSAHDLLCSLLAHVYPMHEASRVSDRLLAAFGSVGALLAASAKDIGMTVHDCHDCVVIIRAAYRLSLVALREPFLEGTRLSSAQELEDYLRLSLAHERREVVRVLFLNAKNRLIRDEFHARGCAGEVALQPREIILQAIDCDARAIIIAHNHPSGDPTPSGRDADSSRELARILSSLGIVLHDHVIVAKQGCISMYALGLL